MAKHLLVDGFNIIRRDPKLSGIESRNFYGAQDMLIERLDRYRRGTSNRVTVVFDGGRGPNPFRSRGQKGEVGIIYSSQGETADEVIVDLLAHTANRSGYLVVTADRELAQACRSLGVGVVPPEELLARTRLRAAPPAGSEYWDGKHEEQGWSGSTRKQGNPKRRPKNKRRPSGLW
jgi:predicted RNA-binding protein with PIN domain